MGDVIFGFLIGTLIVGVPLFTATMFQAGDKHDWQKRYYSLCEEAGATVVAHYGKTEECSLHRAEGTKP